MSLSAASAADTKNRTAETLLQHYGFVSLPKPAAYAWLSSAEFSLHVAGCLTIVVGHDQSAVAAAFGADLGAIVKDTTDAVECAAFRVVPAAVIVLEDNGLQGTRPGVLSRASRASANGKAASVYWNVEGMVSFACATKGKVVTNVELGYMDEPDGLPRSLRRLAALAEVDDADVVGIAAAMVATYTGVSFTEADLAGRLDWHELDPPLDLLPVVTVETTDLAFWARYDETQLLGSVIAAIGAATADTQRQLAERVAAAALAQVDSNHPQYAPVVAQLGRHHAAIEPPELLWYLHKLERIVNKASYTLAAHIGDFPYRSMYRVNQLWRLGRALRYACHPDPLTAALQSSYEAWMSMRLVEQLGGTDLSQELSETVLAFLRHPTMTQEDFNALMTAPVDPQVTASLLAEEWAAYNHERAWHEETYGNRHPFEQTSPFELPR